MAEGEEFLSLTQQLALSSAFGAVQFSYGPADSAQQSGDGQAAQAGQEEQAQPDLLLLARFQQAQQLQTFLACPPVAALLEGDGRIPLRALWRCVLETRPSDSSSTRGVQGQGGLL